jgi:hypothetical protein
VRPCSGVDEGVCNCYLDCGRRRSAFTRTEEDELEAIKANKSLFSSLDSLSKKNVRY